MNELSKFMTLIKMGGSSLKLWTSVRKYDSGDSNRSILNMVHVVNSDRIDAGTVFKLNKR